MRNPNIVTRQTFFCTSYRYKSSLWSRCGHINRDACYIRYTQQLKARLVDSVCALLFLLPWCMHIMSQQQGETKRKPLMWTDGYLLPKLNVLHFLNDITLFNYRHIFEALYVGWSRTLIAVLHWKWNAELNNTHLCPPPHPQTTQNKHVKNQPLLI